MSLRSFHLFFITVALLLAFGTAWFEYSAFREGRSAVDLAVCIFQTVLGVFLAVYGVSFQRKMRHL